MNKKTKNLVLNFSVIFAGIAVGLGIFALLKLLDHERIRQGILPNAVKAFEQKEYSDAIRLFEEALKEFSNDKTKTTEANLNLGRIYFLKGKYDDSLKFYNNAGEKAFVDDDKLKLGEIYFIKEDYKKASDYWQRLKLEPEYTFRLANSYYELDEKEKYISELNKIKNYREPSLLLQINETNLGNIIRNINAATNFKSIEYREDFDLNLSLFKEQIQSAKTELDAGKREVSELIQVSAFSNLKQCRLLKDKISSLRERFVAKRIPVFQIDFYEGVCLNQMGEPDQAIVLLNKAVQYDSTIIDYREALAKSYALKQDADEVQKIYKDIFVIKNLPEYHERLAVHLYDLGKIPEALTEYRNILSMNISEEDKSEFSKIIMQISLIDKKDLEICSDQKIAGVVSESKDKESLIIINHCNLANGKLLSLDMDKPDLMTKYFEAVQKKDKDAVNKALDQDTDGVITTYYEVFRDRVMK